MGISTRNLSKLPGIIELNKVCKSIALLDAIICPEWEYRYFSFNSKWSTNEMMASMRNGCGDDYFILFSPTGAIIKGFWHESPISPYVNGGKVWPGILSDIPSEFKAFIDEPAFSINDTIFCLWQLLSDDKWMTGKVVFPPEIETEYDDPDGSEYLLFILDGNYNTYREWAEEYYERSLDTQVIKDIYNHKPLDDKMVKLINPEMSIEKLRIDIDEIGYPCNI